MYQLVVYRQWLSYPSCDINVIQYRLNNIQYLLSLVSQQKHQQLIQHIANVKGIHQLISNCLQYNVSSTQWIQLIKTIQAILLIHHFTIQLVKSTSTTDNTYINNNLLTHQIASDMSIKQLDILQKQIVAVADINISKPYHKNQLTIKSGINDELDFYRNLLHDMNQLLSNMTENDILQHQFPAEWTQCQYTHIRSSGFFVRVPVAQLNTSPYTNNTAVNQYNLSYRMRIDEYQYYKNQRCMELDHTYADPYHTIQQIEHSILYQLCGTVLQYSDILINTCNKIYELDVLLSITGVAYQFNYCKPNVMSDESTCSDMINIIDGVHPLKSVDCDSFVSNSIQIGGEHTGRIHIITGANSSGMYRYSALCS